MTRKSKREVERGIDDLDASEEFTLSDYMWASLKDYYDGPLTHGERQLVDNPENRLPASELRHLENTGGPP